MLLEDKNAVIYGAGGSIGGAVARAFAREGARVFLTGRTLDKIDAVADEISAAGGIAETDLVDALDERAVEDHADAVARRAGRIDVSFNGIGIPQQGVQGVPLGDLSPEGFGLPIRTYTTAQFLTSRAMARRMAEHGSGVILTITSTAARLAVPGVGGMGAAWAAVEALSRGLAAELGPQGIRVICLRAHGMPETSTIQEVLGLHAESIGLTREQVQAIWEDQTLLRRLPTLAEVADAAAYLASDRAGAMTATVSNLTVGAIAE